LPDDKLKAVCGKMMTLIDDHRPIVPHTVIDDSLPDQALHDSNIENTRRLLASTADLADFTYG
jgi:hypothetical protein